jgi:hypothetical protein
MRRSLRLPLLSLLLVALTAAVWGCPSLSYVMCNEIPLDGCPVASGGTCEDPTCAALYDCDNANGTWVLVQACMRDGGLGGGGAGGAGGGEPMPDAGPCTPPAVDLGPDAGISEGCTEDLENPDCPIAAAEPCVEGACLTGCSDFFICTTNGMPGNQPGWLDVAYCDNNGNFIVITE